MVDELQRALRLLSWECLPPAQRLDAFALPRLCGVCVAALSGTDHPAYKFLAFDLLAVLAQPLMLEDGEWHPPRVGRAENDSLTAAYCSREAGSVERDAGGGGRRESAAPLRAGVLRARLERLARAAGRRARPVHVSILAFLSSGLCLRFAFVNVHPLLKPFAYSI